MKKVGLHLRLNHSIVTLAQRAYDLGVPFFQCFFVRQSTGKFIEPNEQEIKEFRAMRTHFEHLFLHGSYYVNLCDATRRNHRALGYEMSLAQKLGFSHIILHPGSSKGVEKRIDGIDVLARNLNKLLKKYNEPTIVLENTAHGNRSVGGDPHDFKLLLQKLDRPERVSFCIDTSHAYAFGYDITTQEGRAIFIKKLADSIDLQKIVLVHVNDTKQKLGSKIDRHAVLGQGNIGIFALRDFVNDPAFNTIPLLLELPVLDEHEEIAILDTVKTW